MVARRRNRPHGLLTALLLLSLASPLAAADPAFTLKLRRPARAGDQFDVHLLLEQTIKESSAQEVAPQPSSIPRLGAIPATLPIAITQPATLPGKLSAHTIKAELICRVEVVDINLRGEASLLVTIRKFVSLPDNVDLVPAGKVIGLQSDGREIYLAVRGGGDLSEDARAVLQHVHPLENQLDEETAGTPHRVGDSWNADPASVAQQHATPALEIDPASVKGSTTLIGAENAGTRPGLRLKSDLSYTGKDRFRKASGEMLTREQLVMKTNLLLPQDAALPPAEIEITTDIDSTGTIRLEEKGKVEESQFNRQTHTVEKQTITLVPREEN